ncbi:hypothetical protein GIB67_031845, partial [Kingdonia uniflora]
TNAVIRSSVNGGDFLSKMVDFNNGESNVRKSCVVPFSPMYKFPRSKSVTEREQSKISFTDRCRNLQEEFDSPSHAKKHKSGSLQQSRSGCAKFSEKTAGQNVAIHWHGIPQIGSPWSDRTEGLTQCPIMPGDTFVYQFVVDRVCLFSLNFYIYPGHSYTMRIMECKEKLDYTVLYESQFLMELQSHSCLTTTVASYLTIGTIKPPLNKQQEFLQYPFNGLESLRGRFNCSGLTYPSLEPGVCHNMTVVEADGHYVEPFVELKISGYLSSSPPSATLFAFSLSILSHIIQHLRILHEA